MDKSKLKSYAPQARKDFIAMVQSRAAQLGIAEVKGQLHAEPAEVQGDVAVIAGQAFPAKVARQRDMLLARMQKDGFAATVEAIAYTWFNRLAALRYMELHNFLGHGQRVLSSVTEGGLPDLLTHALEIAESGELPGISVAEVSELKLASKDGELYKRLLVAQCNQLAGHMGFLFERIDDDSELMLPDNLLRSDSVVRKLIDSIDEADWQQVEIIGWLYQFYISEKKDQVIGKVVKSADIPAATQLFTPNWIVKYLVQNSVGRLWLQANPASTLASEWAYYIQPAEQTPEVNDELTALIRARIAEDGDTLNPESITVLDPACGSGHILVEAYDLLKAIYLERGYRERDIPRLILEKNLFGLDIDDRAAQLAAFALLMKARADDRRLFTEPVKLNVMALQDSAHVDAQLVAETIIQAGIQLEGGDAFDSGQLFGGGQLATEHSSGLNSADLRALIDFFQQGKTFGSLLQVSPTLAHKLPRLAALLHDVARQGNSLAQTYAQEVISDYLRPAQLLARQYDTVVANPPYMGSKGMNEAVKAFAKKQFPDSKSDLFAMFIKRGILLCNPFGMCGMVTMQSWMFLSSYEALRKWILDEFAIDSLVQIGYNSFPELNSKVAQACAFVVTPAHYIANGTYLNLNDTSQSADKGSYFLTKKKGSILTVVDRDSFRAIPGFPIAHWVSKRGRDIFKENLRLADIAKPRQGLASGDNDRFMRYWYEVSNRKIGFNFNDYLTAKASGKKWFPHNKGGEFRKWYGNLEYVLAFDEENFKALSEQGNHLPSRQLYFKEGMSWTALTSGNFNGRYTNNAIFDAKGPVLFANNPDQLRYLIGFCNSAVATACLKILAPTLDFNQGPVGNLPIKVITNKDSFDRIEQNVAKCIFLAREEWDSKEVSFDFKHFWSEKSPSAQSLVKSWNNLQNHCDQRLSKVKELEEDNNQLFITAYGLQDELYPEVPEDQITLTRADREKDMQRLVSYAIGCMMGRYSLDQPGLIYAHAGNVGFDATRYTRFPADADGIVPVGDMAWFPDDATARVKEFLLAVWGPDTLAENLAWLADSLGRKADETAEDALRRYISGSFFKDHCQTYKKRPIYWLFSSGKHKAFEALVYLHRYNEATLARMRAEYVVPLTGRMTERIALLEDDASKASTGAARKALDKQVDKLKKKLEELRLFDEKLRHYADQRIELDLDDGVKVNYGKFGDLLDNVKAISGGSGDD
ncbi:BREX-1 system adenine-specific DNA-methyltransferase PglX [Laribacter hongkongensis]|uniref:BREX-1 system adenine-specific DNA-methyltransferase PglX n=1 Tax=Laribacter hongkongensis TaxID=168471 RepID=UPI001EFD9F60|nr:BREX-1 system adenine-specific DNA-methyltransferase PglX [Laribacter hongkongensis]MCG9059783.1 BREX-1 system adenine-specific DNA-methyltransferase PglX [Laribacter hongkongensis]MCG9086523.1 BREX-1 system adenine-specific DNA-methyltransferase PglX [Laribacter hongkongensis]